MRKWTFLGKLMYFLPVFWMLSGSPAQAGTFGVNLVVNGDAEAQTAGRNGSLLTSYTGWVADGKLGVYEYQTTNSGYPRLSDPGPTDRGANFFTGNENISQASAYQEIDLSFAATEIDAGTATYDFSGWLGGYSAQGDNTVLALTFYSGTGQALGATSLGPVTPADRQNTTGLLQRSTTGAPPVGTRSAQVTMTMTRVSGSYNDGYADNIELVLTSSSGTGGGTDVVSSSVIRFFNWAEDSCRIGSPRNGPRPG
ncbi:MAG: hypothetical protein WC256_08590 [Desulfurivibrionaceae bacterium]|jgi:hypothetical protein